MIFRLLKAQLALLEKTDQDQVAADVFSGLVADEQSRWTTFNALLTSWADRRAQKVALGCRKLTRESET